MQEHNLKFSETLPSLEERLGGANTCLLNGYDDIDFLLGMKSEIDEKKYYWNER